MTVSEKAVELLPCPFCGGSKLKSGGDDKVVAVWCQDCEATGPNHYNSKADWNRRAALPLVGVERREDVAREQIAHLIAVHVTCGCARGIIFGASEATDAVLALSAQSGSGVEREDVARAIANAEYCGQTLHYVLSAWAEPYDEPVTPEIAASASLCATQFINALAASLAPKHTGQPVEGAREAIVEECAKIAETEPEPTSEMPEDLRLVPLEEAICAGVRATKSEIARRIRAVALSASPQKERRGA